MPDREIELIYDPFMLPTAQHRAGLAGILVTIESMRRRRIKPLPRISRGGDGKILVNMTKKCLGTFFDDLYDAFWELRESDQKPKGKNVRNVRKRVASKGSTPKNGKTTKYTFETVVPKVAFLRALGMPDPWLKLWRESVWATLRGIPRTRILYEERIRKKHVGEAKVVWRELQRFKQAQAKNRLHTVDIASSLFVGAQAENAERVPFRGRADEAFLLHFWPVVMGVYVPEIIDREGKTKFDGFVLAVPDVSDLNGFVRDFPSTIAELGNEVAGYRPRKAVISLPQEGGLEYIRHLTSLARGKAQADELAYNVAGVEVYHFKPPDRAKGEKTIRIIGLDRVVASHELLENYEAIRGRYRDSLFKRQVILNLLRREPWHRGFDRVFARNERERFIGSQAERFSTDARRCFGSGFQERRFA